MSQFLFKLRNYFNPKIKVSDLSTIISPLRDSDKNLNQLEVFRQMFNWLRQPVNTNEPSEFLPELQSRNIRLKYLLNYLERNPEIEIKIIDYIKEIIKPGQATRLFCQTGLPSERGFFYEFMERLSRKLLPVSHNESDMAEILPLLFTEQKDAEWFLECREIIFPLFQKLFERHSLNFTSLKGDMDDALIILGAEISSIGVSRGIRSRLKIKKISDSPFLLLNLLLTNSKTETHHIIEQITECQNSLTEIQKHLHDEGVSLGLVYQTEKLSALLGRIERIVYLKSFNSKAESNVTAALFISELIHDDLAQLSLSEFFKEHTRLLSKKIIESSSDQGDHYIAKNKTDLMKILALSCGGGVVIGFTAIFKVLLGHMVFPVLIHSFFFWMNYSLSFLFMQAYGLILSSKQPSYMASALSRTISDARRQKKYENINLEVRSIVKSQTMAAIGNLLLVVPVAYALGFLYFYLQQEHVFTPQYAHKIIASVDPLKSGTIFFAFLTGIFLWLSSLVSGWVENWLTFNNIPDFIRASRRLDKYFSAKRKEALARVIAPSAGVIAGNLAIGFLLSAPITLNQLFGLPLDARHIAITSGKLALAFGSLDFSDISLYEIISSSIGIIITGVLNFGVSFWLSFELAAKAQGLPRRRYAKYLNIFSVRRKKS